ncbi:Leucine-rich repeat domain superfamily [Sesbania bispinosa]|nr:Leucine-rich repeat domain superfamily [Sesbania bispinosa]
MHLNSTQAPPNCEQEALYSTIQGFVVIHGMAHDLYPDPCGWTPIQGVSCDLFNGFGFQLPSPLENWEKLAGSLESLEFRSNQGLIGNIPSSFGSLKNLQSLVLLENGLTGQIPPDIGNLIKLKRLVLAGNYFSGRIPDIFCLTSVLKLDLSHNHLKGNLLNEFANLKNLTLMDLRNNRFYGGLTMSFEEMYSLEEMVLSNNPLGGDIRALKWENLQNLVILDLSNMGLTGEIPESISELKKLRFLGLSDNNLTGNLSPKLETLPCLNALYLSRNNLTGDLKFSKEFYGKMGRRFGAWNNPNLCYPVGVMSTSHIPYGVKPCQKEVNLLESNTKNGLLNGDMNKTSHFITSMGFSSCAPNGFWWTFLEEILMIGLLLNSYIAL